MTLSDSVRFSTKVHYREALVVLAMRGDRKWTAEIGMAVRNLTEFGGLSLSFNG